MDTHKKPTFYQLRLEHSINIYELSKESGIPSLTVWSMLIGQPVSQYEAQHVLDALNTLRGTRYTLTDIDIVLAHEQTTDNNDERATQM